MGVVRIGGGRIPHSVIRLCLAVAGGGGSETPCRSVESHGDPQSVHICSCLILRSGLSPKAGITKETEAQKLTHGDIGTMAGGGGGAGNRPHSPLLLSCGSFSLLAVPQAPGPGWARVFAVLLLSPPTALSTVGVWAWAPGAVVPTLTVVPDLVTFLSQAPSQSLSQPLW